MLRLEQKWRSQLPTQSGGSKRTKVTSAGAYSSSSNPETPFAEDARIESPVRPQGSKKNKRRGKGKAQMSEDLSDMKSSIAKKLALIEDFMNFREKEISDLKKEREMQKEHIEKLIAKKEKVLQMKEQELYMKEREMNIQILNADTSVKSERRRALHEIA
ncbi:hypothetical protein PIB30_090047, partial [Stylosanthes scabra]|nr:hypothetical protein [Stylosanthes scabra]